MQGFTASHLQAETRKVYTPVSEAWLRAIGKLQVPGSRLQDGERRHNVEDCSATLIQRDRSSKADIIVTAWHCLEFYNDLSRPIYFQLSNAPKAQLRYEATLLTSGGSMRADWAILRLRQAVGTSVAAGLPMLEQRADPTRSIIMAGYSRDADLGQRGERLTFDPACNITRQDRRSSETNCTAFKGASGGAVVQLDQNGHPLFSGVVSQGNGEGTSTFVPVNVFRNKVTPVLFSGGSVIR